MRGLLKLAILAAILAFVYAHINNEKISLHSISHQLQQVYKQHSLWVLLFPVLLAPLNLGLEAWKWKMLAGRIEKITFHQALGGVLAGLGMGLVSQGLGDYAGRIWRLSSSRRSRAVGAVFLGSMAQGLITFLFGCLGFYYFIQHQSLAISYATATSYTVAFLFLLVGFLCFNTLHSNTLFFLPKLKGLLRQYFGVIKAYNKATLCFVLLLSLARYSVFTLQFFWVLSLMGIFIPWNDLLAGITWIFAAKTIVPTFNFLGDLGIREFSALVFFKHYNIESSRVISLEV